MKRIIPMFLSTAFLLAGGAEAQESEAAATPPDEVQPVAEAEADADAETTTSDEAAVAAPEQADDTEGRYIEEIIVTAQKRQEKQQDVPISIQAFSAEKMTEAGILEIEDLGTITPGLQLTTTGTGSAPFMRGVGGSNVTAGQEAPIPLFIDGVYYQFPLTSSLSFNNIERIEVLKGPQGTLFGRNATGGLINVITRDPIPETSGDISLSVGSFETYGANAYGTTGISEKVAADIAVFYRDQNKGFGENVLTGKDTLLNEEISTRSKWKYSGEATQVTGILDYSRVEGSRGLSRDLPEGSIGIGGTTKQGDYWDNQALNDNNALTFSKGVSVKVDHALPNGMDFVSITAFRDDKSDLVFDGAVSSAVPLGVTALYTGNQLTQEFRLLSADEGGNTWIVGAFLMDSEGAANLGLSGPLLAGNNLDAQTIDGQIDTKSYAAFAEYRLKLSEQGRLTAGARYTYDDRKLSGDGTTLYFSDASVVNIPRLADNKKDWSEPSWRLVYDHHVAEDVMVFASYNRGFKSGNFDAVAPGDQPFDPETLDAYEIGIKSNLWGRRLQLNASAFYYDYKNLQLQIIETVAVKTENAAAAKIRGFDLDLIALPTDALEISLGLSVLDGEYKNYIEASSFPPGAPGTGNTQTVIDASGNDLQRTPKFSGNIGGTYTVDIAPGALSATVRVAYNDGFPWDADGRIRQDSYTLLNSTLGFKHVGGVWGVRLIGRNLLNEEYAVHSTASATGDYYAPGDPRTVEFVVDYHF